MIKSKSAYPKNNLKTLFYVGATAVLMFGSVPANAEVELEPGVAKHAEIDALYQRLTEVVSSLDAAPLSEIYAKDGMYLIPKAAMIHGLEGIQSNWGDWFSWVKEGNGSPDMEIRIISRDVHDDTIGYDVGYSKIVQKRDGEPDAVYETKVFAVAKKQSDGEWRFEVDTYSYLE